MQHESHPFYPSRDPVAGLAEDRQRFLDSAAISFELPGVFYASLRDPRVFEAVTGRSLDAVDCESAVIEEFDTGIVNAGDGFPGIFPTASSSGGNVECLVVHDLTRFEETMIAWYEWDEYVLQRVSLSDGRTAQVFVPDLEAIRREYGRFEIQPWSFEAWRSSQLDHAVANACRWMAQRPNDAALVQAGCFAADESPALNPSAGIADTAGRYTARKRRFP